MNVNFNQSRSINATVLARNASSTEVRTSSAPSRGGRGASIGRAARGLRGARGASRGRGTRAVRGGRGASRGRGSRSCASLREADATGKPRSVRAGFRAAAVMVLSDACVRRRVQTGQCSVEQTVLQDGSLCGGQTLPGGTMVVRVARTGMMNSDGVPARHVWVQACTAHDLQPTTLTYPILFHHPGPSWARLCDRTVSTQTRSQTSVLGQVFLHLFFLTVAHSGDLEQCKWDEHSSSQPYFQMTHSSFSNAFSAGVWNHR